MKMTSKEKAWGKHKWRNRRDYTARSQGLLWKSERKRKQEVLEAIKMKVVRRDSRLS
jgi:hypothetical protein